MSSAVGAPSSFETLVLELLPKMMEVDRLSGVRDVLRALVRHFDLVGAGLWELADDNHDSELLIQAQYFRNREQPPFYRLPNDAISANCIRTNRPAIHRKVEGVWDGPVHFEGEMNQLGITAFVSVPIILRQVPESGNSSPNGVLLFYRSEREFTSDEYMWLKNAALLFSIAYRSILKRACLALITSVHATLGSFHFSTTNEAKTALESVIGTIAEHFPFEEIVIYLHNPATDPADRYGLIAKRWPWAGEPLPYYVPGDGATGWTLSAGKAVRINDMSRYHERPKYYQDKYPGLKWVDRFGVEKLVRDRFILGPEGMVFPLAYACIPVLHQGKVKGALRCCVTRSGPYHIDEDVMDTLAITAGMIADWWEHWTHEQQSHSENNAALSLMSSLGSLNREVTRDVQTAFQLHKVIPYFLEVCRKSVPQADIVEVWLQETDGTLRRTGGLKGKCEIGDSQDRKSNAFGYSLLNSIVLNIPDTFAANYIAPSAVGARCLTVAPIITKEAKGILFIAASRKVPWPKSISNSASFLAEQLALYLSVNQQFGELREAEGKLRGAVKEQGELLLDFQHQLRSPVNILINSESRLCEAAHGSPEWTVALDSLKSSSTRLRTVASNLKFFVSLAQRKPVITNCGWQSVGKILEKAEQASRFLYNKVALNKTLSFHAQESKLPVPKAWVDVSLLELAIDNLLDNAVKYSYDNTTIVIGAEGALYGREVFFSFRNIGHPISAEEARRLSDRKYRGEKAKVTSPEGTGIGLWMVDEIMRAMGGRLQIAPTDAKGWNEFRLYLRGQESEFAR